MLNDFFPIGRNRDKVVLPVEYRPCVVVKESIHAQDACLKAIMSDHVLVRGLLHVFGLQYFFENLATNLHQYDWVSNAAPLFGLSHLTGKTAIRGRCMTKSNAYIGRYPLESRGHLPWLSWKSMM